MLRVDQELVVHSLHHNFLRGVLAHIEPKLELLGAAILVLFLFILRHWLLATDCSCDYLLDEGRPEPLEPGGVAAHGASDPRQEVSLPRHLPDIENIVK